MTEQNTKIDGRTKRALDMAIARKQVSKESYYAVLAGELTLEQAKELGRERGPAGTAQRINGQMTATETAGQARAEDGAHAPPQPVSRISKDDRLSPCVCGCGKLVQSRFAPGHDTKMFRVAREHLTEGRELTHEQREYLESSGKMERVRNRLAEDERKHQEGITRKAEHQRRKEGKAETKRRNEELRRSREGRE